jgi:hypothetical protein
LKNMMENFLIVKRRIFIYTKNIYQFEREKKTKGRGGLSMGGGIARGRAPTFHPPAGP